MGGAVGEPYSTYHKSHAFSKANFVYFHFPSLFVENRTPNLELHSFVETAVLEAMQQTLCWKAEYSSSLVEAE